MLEAIAAAAAPMALVASPLPQAEVVLVQLEQTAHQFRITVEHGCIHLLLQTLQATQL